MLIGAAKVLGGIVTHTHTQLTVRITDGVTFSEWVQNNAASGASKKLSNKFVFWQ